jgi:hypothetical protein
VISALQASITVCTARRLAEMPLLLLRQGAHRVRELVGGAGPGVGQVDVGDQRLDVPAVAVGTGRLDRGVPAEPRAGARGSSARIAASPCTRVSVEALSRRLSSARRMSSRPWIIRRR